MSEHYTEEYTVDFHEGSVLKYGESRLSICGVRSAVSADSFSLKRVAQTMVYFQGYLVSGPMCRSSSSLRKDFLRFWRKPSRVVCCRAQDYLSSRRYYNNNEQICVPMDQEIGTVLLSLFQKPSLATSGNRLPECAEGTGSKHRVRSKSWYPDGKNREMYNAIRHSCRRDISGAI